MITIKNENDIKFKKIIDTRLRKNNIEKCSWFKDNISEDINISSVKNNNFLAFDNDKLIGGAIGFVDEEYRNRNIGTNLIKEIEKFALKEHLTGVRMETWNFQAKGFYEKNGYSVFGEIKNCPPGTIDYHLKKEFKQ